MRRAPLLLFLAALAVNPAFAFNPTRPKTNRIMVLQPPLYDGGDFELQIARNVSRRLVSELRDRGFDAVDSPMTYADVQRSGSGVSGIYVELAPGEAYARAKGEVAINAGNAGVDIAMLVSRVAAELRVYDGRTFELVAKRHLSRENVSVVPTGVGVGSYRMSIWFALPFVQYAHYRSAAGAVVRDAAVEIESVAGR